MKIDTQVIKIKTTIWLLPVVELIDMQVVIILQNMIISYIEYIKSYLGHTTSHVLQKQVRRFYYVVASFTWLLWVEEEPFLPTHHKPQTLIMQVAY